MQPAALQTKPADFSMLRSLTDPGMQRVNEIIIEQVQSDIPLIGTLASHLLKAGGKRLRPRLTIAAAMLCGYDGERHWRLAASVEFMHTATLLHDDVVDESQLRRGEATANALWGNKSSVLVGDFLLGRAFQMMVADGSLATLTLLSDAAAIISAGEVHQLSISHDLSITREVYEQMIRAKTAALFSAACEIGAIVSGKESYRPALYQYGEALGMAFQLADDALDYMADEATLGKAIGDDFRDGKVTLPVQIAYANGNAVERNFWKQALENGQAITAADLAHARSLLKKYSACEATLARAGEYADRALQALEKFPASQAKAALVEAAQFSANRQF